MSKNLQVGLVAGGVGLLLVGGMVLFVVIASMPERPAGGVVVLGLRSPAQVERAAQDQYAKDVAAIAAHTFWRVKVSEDRVRKMVEQVRAEPASSVVFIDDQAKVYVVKDIGAKLIFRANIEAGNNIAIPKDIGEHYVWFDLYKDYPARPSLATVASHLRARLDVTDYRR